MYNSIFKMPTFGIEVEYNAVERCGADSAEDGYWDRLCDSVADMEYGGAENEVIAEDTSDVCDPIAFLRLMADLGQWHEDTGGWRHYAGRDHERAESCHFHVAFDPRADYVHATAAIMSALMEVKSATLLGLQLLAPWHLSRTKYFRTAVSNGRQHSYVSARISSPCVPYNSKSAGITYNDDTCRSGTIELRMNSNPAPIVPALVLPSLLANQDLLQTNMYPQSCGDRTGWHAAQCLADAEASVRALGYNPTTVRREIVENAIAYWQWTGYKDMAYLAKAVLPAFVRDPWAVGPKSLWRRLVAYLDGDYSGIAELAAIGKQLWLPFDLPVALAA